MAIDQTTNGNRKPRTNKADKSVILSENMKNLSVTRTLCRVCKSNPVAKNVEEEVIVNTQCNIDRYPRFVNEKAKSYRVIYAMCNCGIIVDFLERE